MPTDTQQDGQASAGVAGRPAPHLRKLIYIPTLCYLNVAMLTLLLTSRAGRTIVRVYGAVCSDACSIPACMLPSIVSSSEVYCVADNPDNVLNGVRVAGILGDQQVTKVGELYARYSCNIV